MPLLQERTIPSVEVLHSMVGTPGPWVSVYVGLTDVDAHGLPVERAVRWQALAASLHALDAPPGVVAAIGDAVAAEGPGPAVLAAFATADGPVRLVRVTGLDQADIAVCGSVPHVLPLLHWLEQHPAHVLVVTDRTGADVDAVDAGGQHRSWSVIGPDDVIERNAPGGWAGLAQGRYQHRAEDSWRHNAARVADSVADAVREIGARVVVVAGDVRAVQLLEERVPADVQHKVAWRHIGGGRSEDGSQRTRPARVEATVRGVVAEDTAALLARFVEERAPGGVGVEGIPQTLQALSAGEVAELVLVPGALDGRMAWIGPRPGDVLPEEDGLPHGWPGPDLRAPLPDAVVRAALATGARVRLVPAGQPGSPAEGLGALRRFRA
jgi:hypothetical protein